MGEQDPFPSDFDYGSYGKPRPGYETEDHKSFEAAGGYGVPGSVMNRPGMTKGAAVSYLDTTDSEAFRKRLNNDLFAIGGRTAPQAGTTQFGAAGRMAAAGLGPAATYGGASLDLSNDAATRAEQVRMLQSLRNRAMGIGQTPGESQFRANLTAQLSAANAGAMSARGRPNAGLALRNLGASKAATTQGAMSDLQILRAQDQQAARGHLANLASSGRAADFHGAETGAGFAQNAAMFSADAQNKFGLAGAGFQQGASLFNANAAQLQAELNQKVALSNLESQLRAQGLDDAAIAQRVGMYQEQINRDKQDAMNFYGYASGNRKFNAAQDYQKMTDAAMDQAQMFASGAKAAGGFVGMAGKYNEDQKKRGG
jgi:hypothetical protein